MLFAVGILFLVLSWWQPMHLLPWVSWHSEMLAFSAIFLMASGVFNDIRNSERKSIRIPFATLPLFLLAIVVTLQKYIGLIGFSGDCLVVIFYIAMGALALVVGFNITKQKSSDESWEQTGEIYVNVFAGAVLIAATGSIILAFAQTLNVWDSINWINRTLGYRRPGGNLSQTNHLATLSVMGIASLLYLYEAKKLGLTVTTLILTILISGVAITESRSGAISFCFLMIWWFFRRDLAKFIIPRWLVFVGSGFFLILLWLWPKFIEYFHSGGSLANSQLAAINLSAGARLVVWPQLIDATWEHPWFGWGVGGVSTALNGVLHNYGEGYPFTYAHNIVLDMTVGMGIPLTVLFVIAALVWIWRRLSGAVALLPWYCVGLILPIGIHSMFEFPFAYAYFLLPGLFVVGLLEGWMPTTKAFAVNWRFGYIYFMLLTAALVFSAFEYILVEEDYRVARFEALKVGHTPVDYERPTVYIFDQLAGLSEVFRTVPTPGMSTARIELLRKVAVHFPSFATQNRYALSLALNGKTEEATRQLKVMQIMHGDIAFAGIRLYWLDLAQNKYPQLRGLQVP